MNCKGFSFYLRHGISKPGACFITNKTNRCRFDKFWNQLISEVSQLDIEESTLPQKRKMPKRFDEFASHYFYETPKDLYRRTYFVAYGNVIKELKRDFRRKIS